MVGLHLGISALLNFAGEFVVDSPSGMNPVRRRVFGFLGLVVAVAVVLLPLTAWVRSSVSEHQPKWIRMNTLLLALSACWWILACFVPSPVLH